MSAMNDRARQALRNLVAERGAELGDDPQKLGSLLRDECGEHKAEIHVLVEAARALIPHDLLAARNEPVDLLVPRLATRLSNERGTNADAADWAVRSWAIALGLDAAPGQARVPRDSSARDAKADTGGATSSAGGDAAKLVTMPLMQRVAALFRKPDGTTSWIKVGLAAFGAVVVFNLLSNKPPTQQDTRVAPVVDTRTSEVAKITGVSYLRLFPADGRKAWFNITHTGNIDRIDVQFLAGDWKAMTLTPESGPRGPYFSFWLSSQRPDVGRIRLIPVYNKEQAGQPVEFEFAAVSPGSALPPTDSSMRITDIAYTRQVVADGGKQKFQVTFSNDNAGPLGLELVVLRGRLDHQLLRYAPSSTRNGHIEFFVNTIKPENIVLRARLVDSEGRRSNFFELPFDVLAPGRSSDNPNAGRTRR